MLSSVEFAERLLMETPDAILFADCDGIIQLWNRGCERIFGYGEDDAIGRSLDIIIPQTLRARHWEGYAQTIRTGYTRYGVGDLLSVPAIKKDGGRISVEFSITPFREPNGRMIGMAATLRDVTKRFEETKRLRQAAGNLIPD
ncbi:MAG: PAS domain S-box protein [Rhodobiaceae bacterium]|nr:PAS domain S-box protein [Rhodobiaceae bacterium]